MSDDQIRAAIVRTRGHVACPHTACAAYALDHLHAHGEQGDWAAVAIAHPAKFPKIVEPLLGDSVPPPSALETMLSRTSVAEPLADDTECTARRLADCPIVPGDYNEYARQIAIPTSGLATSPDSCNNGRSWPRSSAG